MADLLTTIKNALEKLVSLEIVTAVGPIKGGETSNADIDWDQNPKVILTRIDLLQGDIKTVFDPVFVTGEYQSLRDFHANREKEGHEIVLKNIAALRALYSLAQEWLGQQQGSET
ncbi:MAG: hypothetical protein HY677_03555 [Chloroflexi bacterium]|nr:hypothetical protein [Chloroflexota bacterium]